MNNEGQLLQADAAVTNDAGKADSQQSSTDESQTSTHMMDDVMSIEEGLARFAPSQGIKPPYHELDIIPQRENPALVDAWVENLVFHFGQYDSNSDGYISRQELIDTMSKNKSYAIARGVMENFGGLIALSQDEPGKDFRGLSKADVAVMMEAKERFDFLLRSDTRKGIKAFDTNGDGFATRSEIDSAHGAKKITYDEKNFLNILKNNYRTVITASNDERGFERAGITNKDLNVYQEQLNKRADVTSCRLATNSILQTKKWNITQPQESAAEAFAKLVNGPIFEKLSSDKTSDSLSYKDVTKLKPTQAFPGNNQAQEALRLLQSNFHALAELSESDKEDKLSRDDIDIMVNMYKDGDEHWKSILPERWRILSAKQGRMAGYNSGGIVGGLAGEAAGAAKGYYDGRCEFKAARTRFADFMTGLEQSSLGKAKPDAD